MRTLLGVGVALVLACGVTAAADEKIDAKKLIGKWEAAGGNDKKGLKMVVEYKEGGKMAAKVSFGEGKDFEIDGTYKVDGNKLTQTMTVKDKERTTTSTVLKLTDTEMEAENEKGVKTTYKRVKAEKKKD